ncbi:hypothetical protein NLN82_27320 [Citrobacter portucalensis]|uniref:hypothetical protein n=1 Tax=Citrobacter portucalensis TaxID=1639133 RepID=UPI00226B4D36|nr:hypothetical protein [Citrobacter portucalensis]MCX9039706.1 hypothetical protein [Citrobacter portucalensis]
MSCNPLLTDEELKGIKVIAVEALCRLALSEEEAGVLFQERITPLLVLRLVGELQVRRKAGPVAFIGWDCGAGDMTQVIAQG